MLLKKVIYISINNFIDLQYKNGNIKNNNIENIAPNKSANENKRSRRMDFDDDKQCT